MNTKRAKTYLINPDLFSASQWHEMYYAVRFLGNPEYKGAAKLRSDDLETAGVKDFSRIQILDVITACEEKARRILTEAYGPASADIDLHIWAETLTEAAEILKGIITK